MTTILEPDEAPALWSRVEDGFYVCTVAGAFFGYVDHQADAHIAYDQYSRAIGSFVSLTEAMAAISAARGEAVHP